MLCQSVIGNQFFYYLINMKFWFLLTLALHMSAYAILEATECEIGWRAYKEDLCIKLFMTRFANFHEANNFCLSQGDEVSRASLVLVKDSELDDLLASLTNNVFDYVWLGASYDTHTDQFRWVDGEPLTYTNWQEGYPRNTTASDACIELRPVGAKSSRNSGSKWADVTCQKRNLVMCQKTKPWTLGDIFDEIMKIRRELKDASHERDELQTNLQAANNELQSVKNELRTTNNELQGTQTALRTTRNDLETVAARVVPIGSIYIEYYNQKSPPSLWPNLSWHDITTTYAGLFFRASGGGSGGWGVTQTECAPRITQFQYADFRAGSAPPLLTNIPVNGWSTYGWVGRNSFQNIYYDEGLRFNSESCEVRPKNQAIRVWKRIG